MRSSLGGHFAGHGMYYSADYGDYFVNYRYVDFRHELDKEMEHYEENCGPVREYKLSEEELKKYR